MATLQLPTRGYWTVDDLEYLPRAHRYEVHDGVLEFKQPLSGWHRHVQYRLLSLLLEAGLYADFEVGVINKPRDTRIADLAIFYGQQRDEDFELAHYPPERLRAVIEVVSPSSVMKDSVPQWYADRGIPEYWVVQRVPGDVRDGLITMSELVVEDGRPGYRVFARTTLKKLLKTGYRAR